MNQQKLSEEESLPGEAVQNSPTGGQNTTEEAAVESASTTAAATSSAPKLRTLLKQEAQSRRYKPFVVLAVELNSVLALMFLVRWGTSIGIESISAEVISIYMILMLCFGLLGAGSWGAYASLGYSAYRRRRAFVKTLSQPQDREQIGALLQTLELPHRPVRNLAKQQLLALLPTLRAGDDELLSVADRKILLRLLDVTPLTSGSGLPDEFFSEEAYRLEIDLRLAILKAFETVGGAQEVALLERLASGRPTFSLSHSSTSKLPEEIRDAAQACLPFVQRRANEQRAGTQLLRASSPPTTPSDVLLRPAADHTKTPSEQLLRAGEPPA